MVDHTHEDVDQVTWINALYLCEISLKQCDTGFSATFPNSWGKRIAWHCMLWRKEFKRRTCLLKKLSWLTLCIRMDEPCLSNIKNHIYPHSYRFSKRDGKGETKDKAWAKDKNRLPEGKVYKCFILYLRELIGFFSCNTVIFQKYFWWSSTDLIKQMAMFGCMHMLTLLWHGVYLHPLAHSASCLFLEN